MEQTIPVALLAPTIERMTRDMRFVAWFYIIYGALMCLTIIGAIFGVPSLISGLRLKDAADEFDAFARADRYEFILRAFEKQRSFFFIQKVFIIISLVFMVLYFFVFFTVLMPMIGQMGAETISV